MNKAFLFFLGKSGANSPHQQGFVPRQSCLANLSVHEEAVACMTDEGHAVNFVYDDVGKIADFENETFPLPKTKPLDLGDVFVQ